jgi:hypothetical protein
MSVHVDHWTDLWYGDKGVPSCHFEPGQLRQVENAVELCLWH